MEHEGRSEWEVNKVKQMKIKEIARWTFTQPGGHSVTILKTRQNNADKADTIRKDGFRHATRKTERILPMQCTLTQ